MGRREFITLFGGATLARPLAARAQQSSAPVVGFLHSSSPGAFSQQIAAFRQSLNKRGFVEGRSVAIEFRWAEDRYERLPALAAELDDRFHETAQFSFPGLSSKMLEFREPNMIRILEALV